MIDSLNSARANIKSRKDMSNNHNLTMDFASGGRQRSGTQVSAFGGNMFNHENDEEEVI